MKTEFAIIGGGVAGLAAANRLCDLGAFPLVIEGGCYPLPKVCGEFLSYECLPVLQQWEIVPRETVRRIVFHTFSDPFSFILPQPGKNMPRTAIESQLMTRAKEKGAQILTNTKVLRCKMGPPHFLLTNGEKTIEVEHLICAAGRLGSLTSGKPKFKYTGFKAHIKGTIETETLLMFMLPGAYLGVSQVDQETLNVAVLVKETAIDSAEPLIETFCRAHPLLERLMPLSKGTQWLKARLPEFGHKVAPQEKRCCFIGDAVASIPPVCGKGLSLGILSAVSAAEYAFQKKEQAFHTDWKSKTKSAILWGKRLHYAMLHPMGLRLVLGAARQFPTLPQFLFRKTEL